MNYSAVIEFPSEITPVLEQESMDGKRSTFKITNGRCVITASDAVALRASVNAITKMFTIYEKMQTIQ